MSETTTHDPVALLADFREAWQDIPDGVKKRASRRFSRLDRLCEASGELLANGKPKAERKIAIIGKAPSSMGLAPFGDDSWEIWTLNDTLYRQQVPRSNRHFELHDLELTKQPGYDQYWDWIKGFTGCPFFIKSAHPEVPNAIEYPLGAITAKFGRYFTNTVSYMLAMAIEEGCTDIGLWGVDMAQHGSGWSSEYAAQRPSCEYFIGIAVGLGIKLHIPAECDLLKTNNLYGFETGDYHRKLAARREELTGRINGADQREQQAHDEAIFLRGAMDEQRYVQQWLR